MRVINFTYTTADDTVAHENKGSECWIMSAVNCGSTCQQGACGRCECRNVCRRTKENSLFWGNCFMPRTNSPVHFRVPCWHISTSNVACSLLLFSAVTDSSAPKKRLNEDRVFSNPEYSCFWKGPFVHTMLPTWLTSTSYRDWAQFNLWEYTDSTEPYFQLKKRQSHPPSSSTYKLGIQITVKVNV